MIYLNDLNVQISCVFFGYLLVANIENSDERRLIASHLMTEYIRYRIGRAPPVPYLIQPLIYNLDIINHWGNGALITLRIISILDQGHVRGYRPILKVPQGLQVLNEPHLGGHLYAMDLDSGRVQHQLHPLDRNSTAIGTVLPWWSETLHLIQRAHRVFDEISMIGWDVAITPDGPLIIEGNVQPFLDAHQMYPLGPFDDWFKDWLISDLMTSNQCRGTYLHSRAPM